MLLRLDDTGAAELLNGNMHVLVMFRDEACGPCVTLEPHLETLQSGLNREGLALFICTMDGELYPRIAGSVGVTSYPTFALFFKQATAPLIQHAIFPGTSLKELVPWIGQQATAHDFRVAQLDAPPEGEARAH